MIPSRYDLQPFGFNCIGSSCSSFTFKRVSFSTNPKSFIILGTAFMPSVYKSLCIHELRIAILACGKFCNFKFGICKQIQNCIDKSKEKIQGALFARVLYMSDKNLFK